MDEPTILVKKQDGTTERVPLSSLQDNVGRPAVLPQSTSSAPSQSAMMDPSPQEAGIVDTAPVEEVPHNGGGALSTTTPVTDIFVDEAAASSWSSDDHASPLLEPPPHNASSHASVSGYDEIAPVMNALSFSVPGDLTGRLASLLTSLRKGVRTPQQLHEYARRGYDQGGLGLSEDQASQLVRVATEQYHLSSVPSAPQTRVRRKKVESQEQPVTDARPTAPVVNERGVEALRASMQSLDIGQARPRVQDVMPAPSQMAPVESMGPIDELQSFRLVDFIRLSDDPEEARKLLVEKVRNLQKESFLTYLKGKDAWHRCPLYHQYLDVLATSLLQGRDVETLLDEGNGLSPEQFQALVSFHKVLDA